ncbi:MAG TPA: MYG1 family protein [Baekduia sp.]|nr:MYG1 family protein [Baekduia sp.]
MRVATHPGNFHADDVFAIATLRLAAALDGDTVEVVRTRDEAVQAAADARVDVGGRDDPATGDFDHHQKGGAGERPNGIRYASFGLVWRHAGARLTGSDEAAASIDERLVQGVDANDTGQTIMESLVDDIRPMTVSGVIAALNPAWDEVLSQAKEDARFEEAVAVATQVLERQLAGSAAFHRARRLVVDAIERAEDPRLIELDRNMPWRETVVTGAPEALLVMYPKSDGWGLQAVPVEAGSFDNRLDLPPAWAGLSGPQLAAATGVDDAIFAHAAGFYASAGSREGILGLALQALAQAA